MTTRFSAAATYLVLLSVIGVVSSAHAQYLWVPHDDNPVMDLSFDQTSSFTFRPAVVKKDGLLHMWYGKQTGFTSGSPRSIGYATSIDGITWTLKNFFAIEPSGSLGSFDEVWATDASVIEDGDTLRMWYGGNGRLAGGIGYAWSTNGVDWTKVKGAGIGGSTFDGSMDGASLVGPGVVTPTVVKVGSVFHMWYAKLVADGKSRIGYARSSNGRNWTVVPGSGTAQAVVDVGQSGEFDFDQVWWPWVLYNEQQAVFEMWYQGLDDPLFGLVPRLGCAISSDGIVWEKIAGNGDSGACRNTLAQPAVILDDGIYRMWYALTSNTAPNNDFVLYATSDPLATAESGDELPKRASLVSVYPNPFQREVMLDFTLEAPEHAWIEVHDVLGRLVYQGKAKSLSSGSHTIEWSGRDLTGQEVRSGAYIVKLITENIGAIGVRVVQLVR
jgi:hypothetical protein